MRKWDKDALIEFETHVKDLWEEGRIKYPLHLCGGNEDNLIEVFEDVKEEDWVFSTHRNHYHYLLKGGCPDKLIETLLNGPQRLCKGRSGSMCIQEPSIRFYASAIVGGCASLACGVGVRIKEMGTKEKVWCFVGDGAVDTGNFWEAYRYVCGFGLPVTFIVEDNDRSTTTSIWDRWGDRHSHFPTMSLTNNIIWYKYDPTYGHVGSGKYVNF